MYFSRKIVYPVRNYRESLPGSLVLLFCLLTPPGPGTAAADDLFSGFEETELNFDRTGAAPDDRGNALLEAVSGYAKLGATVNFAHEAPARGKTDWRGLSRLRAELKLETEYDLSGWRLFASGRGFYDFAYGLRGRENYSHRVLREYESELELGEFRLAGSPLPGLDLTIGRQIVVWGRSDNFRVTDILNPLDNREPGLTDIEELRLPVTMTRLDSFHGNWTISLIAVHEHRYDKVPVFGHDFYPADPPPPPERKPARSLADSEFALAVQGIFPAWDLSLYAARFHDDQATVVPAPSPYREHRRLTMAGAAGTVARGNFLFLLEAAHLRGLRFMTDYGSDYARTDLLAGCEYRGLAETVIGLDLVRRHLHGYHQVLADSPEFPEKNRHEAALRLDRDLLHDTLSLTALFVFAGEDGDDGSFQRFSACYDLGRGRSVNGGVVFYRSGPGPYQGIGDNDRCFLELRADF